MVPALIIAHTVWPCHWIHAAEDVTWKAVKGTLSKSDLEIPKNPTVLHEDSLQWVHDSLPLYHHVNPKIWMALCIEIGLSDFSSAMFSFSGHEAWHAMAAYHGQALSIHAELGSGSLLVFSVEAAPEKKDRTRAACEIVKHCHLIAKVMASNKMSGSEPLIYGRDFACGPKTSKRRLAWKHNEVYQASHRNASISGIQMDPS